MWLQPFRLVNVYKKVKISGKATSTKIGHKLGEVSGLPQVICRAETILRRAVSGACTRGWRGLVS